mmetsp:Transcript_108463/g.231611  ORF Transcript_108463/g.231611 Transcript_108463/m.231611 type:complete len:258 (-) Transcript_108463:1866-2639(-)
MHLQDHGVAQGPQSLIAVGLQHGLYDDVRRAALYRRVRCLPASGLKGLTLLPVLCGCHGRWAPPLANRIIALQSLENAPSSPERDDIWDVLARRFFHCVELPLLHLWICLVPTIDHLLGLASGAIQLACESHRRQAVGNAEIDGLREAPLRREEVLDQLHTLAALASLRDHLPALDGLLPQPSCLSFYCFPHMCVHVKGSNGVDVDTGPQRFNHLGTLRLVRQDPEIELAIVGDNEAHALGASYTSSDLVWVFLQGG